MKNLHQTQPFTFTEDQIRAGAGLLRDFQRIRLRADQNRPGQLEYMLNELEGWRQLGEHNVEYWAESYRPANRNETIRRLTEDTE
jgi:hypothetical protein